MSGMVLWARTRIGWGREVIWCVELSFKTRSLKWYTWDLQHLTGITQDTVPTILRSSVFGSERWTKKLQISVIWGPICFGSVERKITVVILSSKEPSGYSFCLQKEQNPNVPGRSYGPLQVVRQDPLQWVGVGYLINY